jgi:putative ABC transport system permease protein
VFGRILWNLLRASRGRLAVALLALVSGAAVISALLNVEFDADRKFTHDFRSLGANLIVEPPRVAQSSAGGALALPEPGLMDESALASIESVHLAEAVAAPYVYVVGTAGSGSGQRVVVAGTWLDELPRLEPWLKIQGAWIMSRADMARCIVGRNAARQLAASPGSEIMLRYGGNSARLTVAGIAEAGGDEDDQIFVNLPVAQRLAGLDGRIGLVELSVAGPATGVEAAAKKLGAALPSLTVRPVRQITEVEGALLGRIRLLIFSMMALILLLTALCVLATMAALAMERRADVGLMKALGGSINGIVTLFLAEAGILGTAGGLLGYAVGIVLAHWIGQRVFEASLDARPEVLPLTLALMIGVALAGALPLRLLGKVKPAMILRGEG